MTKYTGAIQNGRDARLLVSALTGVGTAEAFSAARLLARNWQAVAARPDVVQRMVELAKGGKAK